jgi:hypothetical protein
MDPISSFVAIDEKETEFVNLAHVERVRFGVDSYCCTHDGMTLLMGPKQAGLLRLRLIQRIDAMEPRRSE